MTQPYYLSDQGLSEYLLFHYGKSEEVLPYPFGPRDALGYPVQSVHTLLDPARLGKDRTRRALDLGCAVGRSTFELTRWADEVIGIDASSRFIEAAHILQAEGCLPYTFQVEGQIRQDAVAEVPRDMDCSRVTFRVGDAMDPGEDIGAFDIVHMANLIDRLPDPARCLRQLPGLINPGGQLLLLSPYTWMQAYTPEEAWLGGRSIAGTPQTSLEGLHGLLDADFTLDLTLDLPFLIREHARKYQWSVAQGTRWIRR
ncbi:MAG: putative 4-mercaptohistidine N1-methyltransferase [Kiritimatiellae bacterium]|nr:putative 4-mercaptohistidine N1-methyltransferase [Kiritimatiellia bacterium]